MLARVLQVPGLALPVLAQVPLAQELALRARVQEFPVPAQVPLAQVRVLRVRARVPLARGLALPVRARPLQLARWPATQRRTRCRARLLAYR